MLRLFVSLSTKTFTLERAMLGNCSRIDIVSNPTIEAYKRTDHDAAIVDGIP